MLFKPTERVRCINADDSGEHGLEQNKIYTVSYANEFEIRLKGVCSFWYPSRFRRVNTLTNEERMTQRLKELSK